MSHDGLFNGFISNIIVLANFKSTFSFLADLDVFCFKPNFLATKTTKHIHKKKKEFPLGGTKKWYEIILNLKVVYYSSCWLSALCSHSRMSLIYKTCNLRTSVSSNLPKILIVSIHLPFIGGNKKVQVFLSFPPWFS